MLLPVKEKFCLRGLKVLALPEPFTFNKADFMITFSDILILSDVESMNNCLLGWICLCFFVHVPTLEKVHAMLPRTIVYTMFKPIRNWINLLSYSTLKILSLAPQLQLQLHQVLTCRVLSFSTISSFYYIRLWYLMCLETIHYFCLNMIWFCSIRLVISILQFSP